MTGCSVTLISQPRVNFSRSVSSTVVYFTSKQGELRQSPLSVVAAVSPVLRQILALSSCDSLQDHHILLPQVEEAGIALLLQFLKGGMVTTSLKLCTQLLEILKMLGIDNREITLEQVKKILKQENCMEGEDDVYEQREVSGDIDIDIVYEGQSSNVAKADRVSFITTKSETDNNVLGSSDFASGFFRERLPSLRTPTPPSAPISPYPSSSLQGFNFQDLVSLGMARRSETRLEDTTTENVIERIG